jgi:hypothetical protein
MSIKPWGPINWLLPKLGVARWHIITSASFEDRCVALADWLAFHRCQINSSTLFRLINPPSKEWSKASPLVEANFNNLRECLGGHKLHIIETGLLDQLGPVINIGSLNPELHDSVILDITTLPKRFFLLAFKQLINSPAVQNLLVTYAPALSYPEKALFANALPPSALPGFGRVEITENTKRMCVGVGYTALSVEGLMEEARHKRLDFIFPFPPASPAFRRNWALLSMLMPSDPLPNDTEIHRIHGMDAFEVFERARAWGQYADLDLLPLGPKPHALGMAMAQMRLDGRAELIYAQPQTYRADYSRGVVQDNEGAPLVYAYCLKRNGACLF